MSPRPGQLVGDADGVRDLTRSAPQSPKLTCAADITRGDTSRCGVGVMCM
jgi:hypothetical protein